jgi:hypothetical protein
MAITREIGAELGFDATFVGNLNLTDVIEFLEGRPVIADVNCAVMPREKPDLTAGYSYAFHDREIEALLDQITEQNLAWTKGKTTTAIQRSQIRTEMLAEGVAGPDSTGLAVTRARLLGQYVSLCSHDIQAFYRDGTPLPGVRRVRPQEAERLPERIAQASFHAQRLRKAEACPLFFVQYGTGCPIMDVVHIKTAEAWGVDGVFHFDPSWGAQQEGLLEGLLSHEHDGTIVTLENLRFIRHALQPYTLWNVRGHRGLNTPEVQVLAKAAGADLLKINIPYGCTGGGTDPERLTVDGVYSLRLAAQFGLPYDIPGNDELSGVPPHKTFAGLLIMAMLGLKLGAKPIPKPLLCYSPYMQIHGLMDDNLVDMNVAKLSVWREIIDAPIWPGEPVGFMTHTADRVQSAVTTAAHVALAASLGVDAVTLASTDEAYSKGPISVQARVDTLRAVRDMLGFVGSARFSPTPQAERLQAQIHAGIIEVLKRIAARADFVAAIHEGLLGSQDDGLYPGRVGRGTVIATG